MSKDKHKGVARREKLMAIAQEYGLAVNNKWQHHVWRNADLRRLLKRGELVLRRGDTPGRKQARKRQTYAMIP
jgi:hypothetical protein